MEAGTGVSVGGGHWTCSKCLLSECILKVESHDLLIDWDVW